MNFGDYSKTLILLHILLSSRAILTQSPQEDESKCQQLLRAKNKNVSKKNSEQWGSPWTYKCVDNVCQRTLLLETDSTGGQTSLEVCWLNCGEYGALWPLPTIQTKLGPSVVSFQETNLNFKYHPSPNEDIIPLIKEGMQIFVDRFKKMAEDGRSLMEISGLPKGGVENIVTVHLHIKNKDVAITLETDESYSLKIISYTTEKGQGKIVDVEISGETYFGVRHGLETLTQLSTFDIYQNCLKIVSDVEIKDKPSYTYRGLLIDTGRNFIPITSLRRMVDAMSFNKLNMLHWHLTDSNSFPFYSKSVIQMSNYGAYGASKIYFPSEIKDFVLYARERGVKVIVELDFPAHAGNGWQWGPLEGLGDMALCVNKEPWRSFCGQPPCGQLNPANKHVLRILEMVFKDLLEVFDNDMFHMGGDEVYFQCWRDEPEISKMMSSENIKGYLELWGLFQQRALDALKKANGLQRITPILWTSGLTGSTSAKKFLNHSEYIIQVWEDGGSEHVQKLISENYRLIFSNLDAWYLDQGFGTWLGTDHNWKYKVWQQFYDNDLRQLAAKAKPGQILGGEATLWSEKVNEHNMDMKLWPRGSALAERLWSNPNSRSDFVTARLIHQSNRMIQMGILTDQLQPESCHQVSGYCIESYHHLRI